MDNMEFKTINGFDEYLIYQDGHVYSCRSKMVLKNWNSGVGYKSVSLSKDGIIYKKTIHRLVAEHFIDNPENKSYVDHIDRDKTNNMYWNLRWATNSENVRNTTARKTNKLGEKYISFVKSRNRFNIRISTHNIVKEFKTIEEAIEYRNEIAKELGLVY